MDQKTQNTIKLIKIALNQNTALIGLLLETEKLSETAKRALRQQCLINESTLKLDLLKND